MVEWSHSFAKAKPPELRSNETFDLPSSTESKVPLDFPIIIQIKHFNNIVNI